MPVSALRYEPQVDIQGRNLAEAQADITVRGGIFENSAFQIGATTIGDPQTGHYLAELPVAPAMLGAPRVETGGALILGATNATSGAVRYSWRRVSAAGAATFSLGEDRLRRTEMYQGVVLPAKRGGERLGIDVALARSGSDGPVAYGDHEFSRGSFRAQYSRAGSQTDFFAGYQGKRFGWPNLYTPFDSLEFENLQTLLVLANHRTESGNGDYIEAGAFHRRNKDDYTFDRLAAPASVHPYQHTTWLEGMATAARLQRFGWIWKLRAEALWDRLRSTSLIFGRYQSRLLTKAALVTARDWKATDGGLLSIEAGVAHNDSNRDAGQFAPMVEVAREFPAGRARRIYASFARASQMPSYTALNSNPAAGLFRGNAALGRSISDNLEAGLAGALGGWTTSAVVFFRRDRSLVDWTFRRGVVARSANAVDLDVTGFELVAKQTWARGPDVVIGYTALAKSADFHGTPVDASFYALNYARHRVTVAITLQVSQEFELRCDQAWRQQAPNFLRVVGGSRALLSALGICYRPARWRGWECSLRVDNVWDNRFQDIPAVPAAPRQTSLAIGRTW